MRLSHINVTMPKGGEAVARAFYTGQLGLREIPKPEPLRARRGLVRCRRPGYSHFKGRPALEPGHLPAFRPGMRGGGRLASQTKNRRSRDRDGRPAPWKRFFVRDPFGNRIEIHEAGALRA